LIVDGKTKTKYKKCYKGFHEEFPGMKKPPEDHLYVRPQVLSTYTCASLALLAVA
jgi:hypothetical protein